MCKACHNCIRILMMILNFIIVLCGLGLFSMGLYFYLYTFFNDMGKEGSPMLYGFYVIMGVGAFTVIVGGSGCCGAYHESPCLLGVYFILLLLIFAAEIAGGVLVVLYRDRIKSMFNEGFKKGADYLKSDTDSVAQWMNKAQSTMSCCGSGGPNDYTDEKFPKSCCPLKETSCTRVNAYKKGCNEAWMNWVENNWLIFAGVIIGVAFIELLGLIFSMCLCCTARSIDYDMVETRA